MHQPSQRVTGAGISPGNPCYSLLASEDVAWLWYSYQVKTHMPGQIKQLKARKATVPILMVSLVSCFLLALDAQSGIGFREVLLLLQAWHDFLTFTQQSTGICQTSLAWGPGLVSADSSALCCAFLTVVVDGNLMVKMFVICSLRLDS